MSKLLHRYDTLTTWLDLVVVAACYAWLAYHAPAAHWRRPDGSGLSGRAILVGLVGIGAFYTLIRRRYAAASRRWTDFGREVREVAQVTVAGSVLLLLAALIAFPNRVDLVPLLAFPLLAFALLLAAHALTRYALAKVRVTGRNLRYVAVVGHAAMRARYVERLALNPHLGLRVTAEVDPARSDTWRRDLLDILHGQPIDAVVIALPVTDPSLVIAVELAEREGKEVRVLLDGFGTRLSEANAGNFLGLPMLAFTRAGHDAPASQSLKRAIDLVVGSLAALFFLPFVLAAALAVKLDDPRSPVLYRQERAGLHGRPFTLYKLRTMVPNADSLLTLLSRQNEMDGPVFKIRDDPRVTRPGRLIRRLSLDEVPQLWNVLRGDMSLVGPRPPLPAEVKRYARDDYRRRLAVRPGITGPWQVSGRNDVQFERWMAMDLDYVDHWTLGRDITILAQTISAVLTGRGAS